MRLPAIFSAQAEIIPTPWGLGRRLVRKAFSPSVGQPWLPSPLDIGTLLWLHTNRFMQARGWSHEEALRSQIAFQAALQDSVDRVGLTETQKRFGSAPRRLGL